MAEARIDVARRINEKLGIRDLEMVEMVIQELGPVITDILMEGGEVHIRSLGRFFAKYKENMRDPRNPDPTVKLPPMFLAKFVMANTIKNKVKTKKADYFINEKKKEDEIKDS
tara:strand:+ start:16721 stop:17059 length:339 start_codon:yes stop_codon:yes gene_type:complete